MSFPNFKQKFILIILENLRDTKTVRAVVVVPTGQTTYVSTPGLFIWDPSGHFTPGYYIDTDLLIFTDLLITTTRFYSTSEFLHLLLASSLCYSYFTHTYSDN